MLRICILQLASLALTIHSTVSQVLEPVFSVIANQLLAMSSTPTSDPEKKVEVLDEDDAVLAQLGYTQGKHTSAAW
jgi:hypothetical protein